MNPWVALIAAGLCEIGWPLGFKVAQTAPAWRMAAISLSVASMALSGWLLFLAQKQIPLGTAYAVWTGIGAAGTFILGVAVFGDALNWGRALGVAMIIGGVVVLKAMTP
ncbi:Quaternary ammonium compound-resistance protein SugE [bioreactor metagenome]|uniref:Quaternary ammonium compound-resistance protein SugE n=1 Tax=bioreactor metagenome TaxID=1076179 RepID=A0A644SZJ1_9ZZZZ|nr:multidrug efflux SMR transporter [Desulfovibrio desulfuricans]MEA4990531.1 multidrug efflux SMR transporter [Desulfovibrio desulfuricans]